jgi:succinate dehydrogenase/fumarate reductase cytochrome b subunit
MNYRIFGWVLFLIGIVLLVLGIMSTQKTGEKVVAELSGQYTHATMMYIIGGIVLIVGGFGITRIKR